jgi:hypothetical protein
MSQPFHETFLMDESDAAATFARIEERLTWGAFTTADTTVVLTFFIWSIVGIGAACLAGQGERVAVFEVWRHLARVRSWRGGEEKGERRDENMPALEGDKTINQEDMDIPHVLESRSQAIRGQRSGAACDSRSRELLKILRSDRAAYRYHRICSARI